MPSDNLLSMYLKELKEYPPLTEEEETKLALASLDGDLNARKELVERNVRFACKIALDYKNKGMDVHELICSANEGLCLAAERFNPVLYNARFQTYASYWIKQAIIKAFSTLPEIHIPAKAYTYWKVIKKLKETEDLTDEQLAERLGCSVVVAKALREASGFSFISTNVSQENEKEVLDIKDSFNLEETVSNGQISQVVRDAIEDLPEKEKDIISRCHGIGRKQEAVKQIAESYKLSCERIRQIERQARVMLETRLKRKYSPSELL